MRLCLETGRTQYSIQQGQGNNVLLWCKWEKFISYGDILVVVVILYIYIYIYIYVYIKVKESRNRPGVAQMVPGGLGSHIS